MNISIFNLIYLRVISLFLFFIPPVCFRLVLNICILICRCGFTVSCWSNSTYFVLKVLFELINWKFWRFLNIFRDWHFIRICFFILLKYFYCGWLCISCRFLSFIWIQLLVFLYLRSLKMFRSSWRCSIVLALHFVFQRLERRQSFHHFYII